MCGRFFLFTPEDVIAERFELNNRVKVEPRYNIAPTQDIVVVRIDPESSGREPVMLRWGLLPFWAEDQKISYKMINAQSETAAKKPAFRAAFKYRRCIIPADGFYEWKKENKKKQPYVVRAGEGELFGFAGLWEHWEGPDGEVIESCTILTTEPNEKIKEIHNRMPVILEQSEYAVWLDTESKDAVQLQELLTAFPADKMKVYPVSTLVNKPQNDGPDCIAPLEEKA